MVKRNVVLKVGYGALVMLMAACILAPIAFAQEDAEHAEDAESGGSTGDLTGLGLGLGAGLAVGLAGLGTGLAQSGVGAGGTGAIAEKPELFANVLILFAIPETIVILGFVIAFLLLGAIG